MEGELLVLWARRLHKHLRRQSYPIARCTVVRLMRDLGIRGVQRGRKQFKTHSDKTADRPPDLVKRVFTADAPNRLWLADITYCSTWEGWLYRSAPGLVQCGLWVSCRWGARSC